ncbi:HIRA-interacting protein 3 isoform X2 [Mastacembelus armatus]|uniref:HIRA-interacting protein 3 isoform X2 n=1 Tax=Mastacembelus armatus TaxID=205130 RepID=UPI000E464AA1|nr:HIRA-interacting protein 3 isoform X2 [Mastacembelus armatus]
MMASKKEAINIRSTLTLGILKKQYLAHVGQESLSPEARNYMKKVVEEELMKMQHSDKSESELETKNPQIKRKREKENDEVISGREEDEDESQAKKSRYHSNSSSESEGKGDCKTESEESEEEEQIKSESEDAEQEIEELQQKTNGNHKRQVNSDDSTDETNRNVSPKEMVETKATTTKNREAQSNSTSQGKKKTQIIEENDTDTDGKSERNDKDKSHESSDDSEKEVSLHKKNNDSDSDSSSLPSLEDEKDRGTENKEDHKKKKTMKKDEGTRNKKDDNKAVVRLKRYISLCGVRRNYKKLLDGCHSVSSKVAALKKELEELGVHGQPSIEKCKKVRMKREEAQELAALDVSNIISTQGRPKRRGTSAWQERDDPPPSTYQRTLNSGSDSDQENNTQRGCGRATKWANLQGIISDDADSD